MSLCLLFRYVTVLLITLFFKQSDFKKFFFKKKCDLKVCILGNSLTLPFMYVVKYQNALFMFRLWIIFLKSKPLPDDCVLKMFI